MTVRAWLCGLLFLATPPLGAGERLMIRVSPAVAFAPANLLVRATVEADKDNRAIEIVADSDDFYGSSEVQLDGAAAPRITSLEFRSLPPGTYQIRVTLMGANNQPRAFVRAQVSVIATGAAH
jgi:hypothetical protein